MNEVARKEDWVKWNWRRPSGAPRIAAHLTQTRNTIAPVMSYSEQWVSTLSTETAIESGAAVITVHVHMITVLKSKMFRFFQVEKY